MTIVLQNQFWDLKINKNKFSVVLLFNKKKEHLRIPFNTIVKFYDPFVKFSIQLEIKDEKKQVKKPVQKKREQTNKKLYLWLILEKKMTKNRIETDSIGQIEVPSDKLWGAQTQRSLENFPIGQDKMPRDFIKAFAIQKSCRY